MAALLAAAAAPLPRARQIEVPRGYRAEIFARGLDRPTSMAFGPDRRLYVAQEGGQIVVVGRGSSRPRVFASGFDTPLGLAWSGARLFVSAQGELESVNLRRGRAIARRTIVRGLPFGRHQQDNVVIGRDGRLYFGSGSTCDVCAERDPRSATVLSVRPNGRGLRVEARGLRNPFGLARQPGTARIYVSVNGQDRLGAGEPAEMVVLLRRGAHYGWPRCWPSFRRRALVGDCGGVTPPVAYLEPHSGLGGLDFMQRNVLVVAGWGQYASRAHGRKLYRLDLRPDGSVRRHSVFARGFGHPLAVLTTRDGSLLVSDWERGVIYRISVTRRARG